MENTKSENKILLIAFYMFGIGALVAWNAILSIMDFFQKFQKEYSPEYVYPNMNFVLNLVFQFLLVFIGNKFSYKLQLLTCMIMSGIALVLLPIVTYSFNGLVGFIATSFIILFQGFANAVVLSGLYGLASFLPGKYILAMSTGQGISGVLMNIVRYIVILSFGDSDDDLTITKSAIVFFAIAALIVITNIYFLFQIYKDSYFIQQLAKSGEFSQEVLASHNILIEEEDKININPNPQTNSDSFKTEGQSDFKRTMSFILDLCFLLALNYLITFIVFPGVSIKGKLFSLSPSLNINTLILIFNVGDTIGRKLPSYLKLDKNQVGYIVFFRFIFLLTFSFIAIANDSDNLGSFANSTFVIINMIIFSLTNGFITSSLFSIAPGLVPNELKGMSGSILSFFLIIGIFSGTLYALFIIKNII